MKVLLVCIFLLVFLTGCLNSSVFLCGNGICDDGENVSCLRDCLVKENNSVNTTVNNITVVVPINNTENLFVWSLPDDIHIELVTVSTTFKGNHIYQITAEDKPRRDPMVFDNYVLYVECGAKQSRCEYDNLVLYDLVSRQKKVLNDNIGKMIFVEGFMMHDEGIVWAQRYERKNLEIGTDPRLARELWFYDWQTRSSRVLKTYTELNVLNELKHELLKPVLHDGQVFWFRKTVFYSPFALEMTLHSFNLASSKESFIGNYSIDPALIIYSDQTHQYVSKPYSPKSSADMMHENTYVFIDLDDLSITNKFFDALFPNAFNDDVIVLNGRSVPGTFVMKRPVDKDILLLNFSTSILSPSLFDSFLVYAYRRDYGSYTTGPNLDIFLYDFNLSVEMRLSSNIGKQSKPYINSNKVVWLDARNRDGSFYINNNVFVYLLEDEPSLNEKITFNDSIFGDYTALVTLEGIIFQAVSDVNYRYVESFDFPKKVCFEENKISYGDLNFYVEYVVKESFCKEGEFTLLFTHNNNGAAISLVEE